MQLGPVRSFSVAPVGLDGQVLFATEREPAAGVQRAPDWRAMVLEPAFAAIHDPTVKLTDRRWWATQTAERRTQSAALLGVHPDAPGAGRRCDAFRLEIPRLVLR